MVTTLLKSTLREIRQSLGRYLAILAIIALGVGFFSGLRTCQPAMMATGVSYLDRYDFYDFRLMSTLGFTGEDVEAIAEMEGVESAVGSVYAEFLWQRSEDDDVVLLSHMLTDQIDKAVLVAGRMPQSADECLGDARYFSQEDVGRALKVSEHNAADTRDLLVYDEYTIVGLANSPLYMNFERGTASIGSGSVAAFVLIPEEGFEFEAYHEIYLRMKDSADAYSNAYQQQIDAIKPQVEEMLKKRANLRYDTLYQDALEEIRDGEQELSDGWEEYHTERAEAEQELQDAYADLLDGEKEYADGVADYEQGLREYEDALKSFVEAEQELKDGWVSYEEGRAEGERELSNARSELEKFEQELMDGYRELSEGRRELEKNQEDLKNARHEMEENEKQLLYVNTLLETSRQQLEQSEEDYQKTEDLYLSGEQMAASLGMSVEELFAAENQAAVEAAFAASGNSWDEFKSGWNMAEERLEADLTSGTLEKVKDQLNESRTAYEKSKKEYDDNYAKLLKGQQELEAAEQKLSAGISQLEVAQKQLDDARNQLGEGWNEYYEGRGEFEQELLDAERGLLDGEADLKDAKAELADAKTDLDTVPGEMQDARQELDEGWIEYEDGFAKAETEFADAEAELRDGEQEIAEAYLELEDLKNPNTYTLTRKENAGYVSFDNDTSIVASVSLVFPIFFFLVAALVCMTTMKRMVDEQRTQIGVLKAIGYSNAQIIGKYLFYSGSAAAIGAVIGYILGSWGMPLIIWEIYGMMYGFAPLKSMFDPLLAVVSIAAALLCSMGTTYLSCRVELTRPAAELIRPKTPKAGKRVFLEYITPIWKRMSFLRKVSVRNVLRYRSRMIMMILGIGGCTALLVTGFGIRDSVSTIADDQYNLITLYDYSVDFRESQTSEQAGEFLSDHGWEPENGLLVHSGSTDIVTENASKSVYLVIPEEGRLDGFISLHSGEREISFPEVGNAVITRGLAQNMGIDVGDAVSLRDETLGTIEVTVSDICDHHIFHYVYIAPETYQQQLNSVPEYKTLYVLAHPDADPYAESVQLAGGDEISSISVNAMTRDTVENTLNRLNLIIVVVVAFAAALAFIVLYNLTNINITERVREIATIKVLGFHQNEQAAYVFREINMLSVAASFVGLLMGTALHAFVMEQVKVDGMYFPRQIEPVSYLMSVLLTLLFTVIITNCLRSKLKKIDMAESLKSIE